MANRIVNTLVHQLIFPFVIALAAIATADDSTDEYLKNWPQWRGPLATGVGPNADPPTEWSGQKNLAWRVDLPGDGNSTPIIWGDHVIVLSALETARPAEQVLAEQLAKANEGQLTKPPQRYHQFVISDYHRDTGKLRWQKVACEVVPHEGKHQTNSYSSASPTTDGQFVYASFGSHGIYCFDLAGRHRWTRDLGDMKTRKGWGEGSSPVIADDLLLVNWDHENDSFLTALDTKTGQTRWLIERDEPTSWSTPLVLRRADPLRVITSATNRVRCNDARSGQILWECGGLTTNVIASPVANQSSVFCMSWYGKSRVLALPIDARGDLSNTDQVQWSYSQMAPYCPSPLLIENRLYFLLQNLAVMVCLDTATGRALIRPTRLPNLQGNIYASPIAAADRIYIVARNGTTIVLKDEANGFHLLATNQIDDRIDASPAIAGDQLFLRGKRTLYCFALREED